MYDSRDIHRREGRESMAGVDQEERRNRLSCLSGLLIEKK